MKSTYYCKLKIWLLEEITIQLIHFTDKELQSGDTGQKKKQNTDLPTHPVCFLLYSPKFIMEATERIEIFYHVQGWTIKPRFIFSMPTSMEMAGKYSKIFILVFLSLNFSLSPSQFKRLCVSMPWGDTQLSRNNSGIKNFLNYIFKSLSSLWRREFDEKKHTHLNKIDGTEEFCP